MPDVYAVPFALAVLAALLATVSIRRDRWMARRLSRSVGDEFAEGLELLHACHRIRVSERRLARPG